MSELKTKGGKPAHFFRRFFHMGMVIIPFIYYFYLIPYVPTKNLHILLMIFIIFILVLEFLRVRFKIILIAQRSHEATQISSLGWTLMAMSILLIFSPSYAFSIPIVATCAFVDPLIGEMRLKHFNTYYIILIGLLLTLIIWLLCAWYYHFSWWIAFLIAPITIAVEWPSLKWIDDNALMLLVPLLVVLVV